MVNFDAGFSKKVLKVSKKRFKRFTTNKVLKSSKF